MLKSAARALAFGVLFLGVAACRKKSDSGIGRTDTLPTVSVNIAYSAFLTPNHTGIISGQAPLRYTIVSGALPLGLELDANSGEVNGITAETGSFTFTVRVTDAGTLSLDFPLVVEVLPVAGGGS